MNGLVPPEKSIKKENESGNLDTLKCKVAVLHMTDENSFVYLHAIINSIYHQMIYYIYSL
jgi:hypothetical protein